MAGRRAGRGFTLKPGRPLYRRTLATVLGAISLIIPAASATATAHPVKTPLLIKAALAHVQFETIHPFLDGNGRLGRLLITFLFCAEGALREPLLYLSLYFKQHRQQYYDLLQSVRLTGDWEAWLRFFLTGVEETATQAGQTAKTLMKLAAADEKRIQAIGKASGSLPG